MSAKLYRTVSQSALGEFAPLGTENTNVEFVRRKTFWVFYVVVVFFTRFVMGSFFKEEMAWTAVHFIHNLGLFLLLHWNKGTINAFDWGLFDKQTFWEQIDNGKQYTIPRKLFTLMPIFIFLAASYASDWDKHILMPNVLVLLMAIVPKHRRMMGIRIAGLNM